MVGDVFEILRKLNCRRLSERHRRRCRNIGVIGMKIKLRFWGWRNGKKGKRRKRDVVGGVSRILRKLRCRGRSRGLRGRCRNR